MKKLTITLGLILIVAQASWAQTFSIQGVLKDQYGKSLPDGYYAVTFSLYDAQTGGSALWSEIIPSLQTQNGMFETELGAVNPFGSLAFDQNYWLSVAVEDNTEMPRMKLLNMPYSFAAKGAQNRFPSSGNVGIGVTEPESRLSISGDGETYVTVQSSGEEAGYAFAENGNAEWIIRRVAADSTLRVTEAGVGDVLTVRPGGDVGIGTDEPASKIHVGGGDLTVDGELTSEGDEGGLWMGDSHFIGGDGADNLGIRAGDEWSLTVTPEGKVGIGTTDPTEMLEVAGNIKISGEGAVVFPDETSIRSLLSDYAAPSVTNPGNLLIHADSDADTSNTGGIMFNTGNRTHMLLSNNGNLGIGTTNPQKKLDIAGNINFTGELKKNGVPITTSPWLPNENNIFYDRGHIGIGVENPQYTLDVDGFIKTNYATGFYLNGQQIEFQPWIQPFPEEHPGWTYISGKHIYVYLDQVYNWTQPEYQAITPITDAMVQVRGLSVGGWHDAIENSGWNFQVLPNTTYNYIGLPYQRWYYVWVATTYADSYSEHNWGIRNNERSLNYGLKTVMSLNGTNYDINTETHPFYKDRIDKDYSSINKKELTDNMGYVAQELKEVIPEMVEIEKETGYYIIKNPSQILPVIVEAIKELNGENEAIEERIKKLEAGIQKLKGQK